MYGRVTRGYGDGQSILRAPTGWVVNAMHLDLRGTKVRVATWAAGYVIVGECGQGGHGIRPEVVGQISLFLLCWYHLHPGVGIGGGGQEGGSMEIPGRRVQASWVGAGSMQETMWAAPRHLGNTISLYRNVLPSHHHWLCVLKMILSLYVRAIFFLLKTLSLHLINKVHMSLTLIVVYLCNQGITCRNFSYTNSLHITHYT